MMPQDARLFQSNHANSWLRFDESDFAQLAAADGFSVAEKVHLARVALQQQWICDLSDTPEVSESLETFGFTRVDSANGFLVVSGSVVLAQYADFRSHRLSQIEVGILYGYASSAVLAFAGIIPSEPEQRWPSTAAEYYLGGCFSKQFVRQERVRIAQQWAELARVAPTVTALAERSFRSHRNPLPPS